MKKRHRNKITTCMLLLEMMLYEGKIGNGKRKIKEKTLQIRVFLIKIDFHRCSLLPLLF